MNETKTDTLYNTTFIVCDTETTGMSPVSNRLTEIALLKIYNFELVDTYKTLINPQQYIPSFITKLTGITNEDVMNKPEFNNINQDILTFMTPYSESDNIVFVGHNVSFDYKFIKESFNRIKKGEEFDFKTLCTCKLARRILKKLKSKSLTNVTAHLQIERSRHHRAYDDALATAKVFLYFLEYLEDNFDIETLSELLIYQNTKIYTEENKSPALRRINLRLKDLPSQPGVYFMKSRSGEIIYIGKAKNLRERVSTYFRHNSELSYKIKKLLSSVHHLEFEITKSELSALILESRLIKKHKPRFNTAIKRFRYHPFLKINIQDDYPYVEKVYEIENDGANYYGPFRSGLTVNMIVKDIYDKFKLRKCSDKNLKPAPGKSTCMYFDIGRCDAPCNISISQEEYAEEVQMAHNYIVGESKASLKLIYRKTMIQHSEHLDFEKASFFRDRLKDIEKVMSFQKVITSAINDKNIIIKCNQQINREIFFIQNGKLVNTFYLEKENEFNQEETKYEILESVDYFFFSINKYVKHRYTQQELDEIKVISNWLALTSDRRTFLEITPESPKEKIIKFIFE
jgi:DNA polymerase III epsilon subunit family exonuclease